jgi:hypothetical protein
VRNNFDLKELGTPLHPVSQLVKSRSGIPVCPYDRVYEILCKLHGGIQKHAGQKAMWQTVYFIFGHWHYHYALLIFIMIILQVSQSYEYIPQAFVEKFVSACRICACHKSFPAKVAAKPIESRGFLDRIQVDMICMSHIPDNGFKYICHVRDHFSRFSWAQAMLSKQAKEVARYLFEIFTIFGSPLILHSDNGKEFVADVISELLELWPDIKVIHGRPRHPQSQGCVERGNKILQERLGKWMASTESTGWSVGLPLVIRK